MTSRNKMRKAKNSYCANALKFGKSKLKRIFFFDAAQRKRRYMSIVDYVRKRWCSICKSF